MFYYIFNNILLNLTWYNLSIFHASIETVNLSPLLLMYALPNAYNFVKKIFLTELYIISTMQVKRFIWNFLHFIMWEWRQPPSFRLSSLGVVTGDLCKQWGPVADHPGRLHTAQWRDTAQVFGEADGSLHWRAAASHFLWGDLWRTRWAFISVWMIGDTIMWFFEFKNYSSWFLNGHNFC
jgi:hypothetical protein